MQSKVVQSMSTASLVARFNSSQHLFVFFFSSSGSSMGVVWGVSLSLLIDIVLEFIQ